MTNRDVDFVSDAHFLACVGSVCKAYHEAKENLSVEDLKGNGLDPFKTVFDIANRKLTFNDWAKNEEIRQADKTLNNKIGEFHQKLLGGVKGWVDLGVGNVSKLDLKNNTETIFIELKNKENTVNADSADKVRDKLEKALADHPKATVYWAYIISKNNDSGEKIWEKKGRKTNDKIRRIWGAKVYELVTNDKNALKKTWEALPLAISDYFKGQVKISATDMKSLVGLFGSSLQ